MNVEQARYNMIEQQIRTWDVLDQGVLDLLSIVKRERFVPRAFRDLAFVDMELPLPGGECMLPPKIEARMLQELDVQGHELVLEIGAGSGYMAALLAHKARSVTTVEIDEELCEFARSNLAENGVTNVRAEKGDAAQGWPAAGEVDILVVSGSLPILPDSLLRQLKVGGRMAVFVGDAPAMTAQLVRRLGPSVWETQKLFETDVRVLRNALQPNRFTF